MVAARVSRKAERALRRRRRRQNRRAWLQRGVIVLNVFGIVFALGAAFLIRASYGRIEAIERVELGGTLTPADAESSRGQRVLNVLLVGSDSAAALDDTDPIRTGRQGERNGDVIIVAHIDERDGSAALLSIPRDLWVPIAGADREAKINSAFAVGGPAMLVDTIEENFGIPIHHYVNIDFAGFQGLVDALGEVEVWFETPARDWNTQTNQSQTGFEMLERGCQALDGPAALAYVRSRYYQTMDDDGVWVSEPASDLNRIRRQQGFLKQVAAKAISSGSRNPFVFSGLVDVAVEHVTLDQELTPALLLDLGGAFRDFDSDSLQAYSLPAEFGWVGSASVLFADAQEAVPILELYRGAESTDPRTVRVEIAHTLDTAATAGAVARSLLLRGFGEVPLNLAPLEHAGIELRYGPGAGEAAAVVADEMGEPVRLVEVGGLPGRTVVIAIGDAPSDTGSVATEIDQAPIDLDPAVSTAGRLRSIEAQRSIPSVEGWPGKSTQTRPRVVAS